MEQLELATIVAMWHDMMEFINVQYNPNEITFNKGVQVAEIPIPGLDTPLLQFVRGQSETLTLDLFFDTTENGMGQGATSVTTLTDQIYQLMKIDPHTHAPPICAFLWNEKFPGSDVSSSVGNQRRTDFQCVVESIKQRFTLFSPEGVPLRAILTVTLREYKPLEDQLRQLNLNSPDKTQGYVVRRGDTLTGIAARQYLRPGEWRAIASANDIDDPRRMEPGTFLQVPPIT
jgi:nucleoid-associated protein YgaU